jgi:hypothetical protein
MNLRKDLNDTNDLVQYFNYEIFFLAQTLENKKKMYIIVENSRLQKLEFLLFNNFIFIEGIIFSIIHLSVQLISKL